MNVRTPLIRAALAATMIAGSYTIERVAVATDAHNAVAMRVDATAPVRATLMPALRVSPHAAGTQLEATDPLPVTLLPTVHVTASMRDFAALPSFDMHSDAVTLLAASN